MRTYDNLVTLFLSWMILIIGYVYLPFMLPQFGLKTQEYFFFALILCLLAGISLVLFFIMVKKQQNLISNELQELKNDGITIFDRKYEKLLYSRDVADLPKIVSLLINHHCIAVIQPNNIEELKKIINFCEGYQIPLIPRGAGTSGYGGVLPVRNGVIIDLTKWNRIFTIDESNETVEVECGIIWENLRSDLNFKGFTLLSYPSSAPSSTVGGWVNQGGYGVGSSKYGNVRNSIESITVIGTEGKEFKFNDPSIFIGSCGTIGIVWKIVLKIERIKPIFHYALSSQSQHQLLNAIIEYQSLSPYFLKYNDIQNLKWKNSESEIDWKSEKHIGGLVSISFQKENWDESKIKEITNRYSLLSFPTQYANHYWEKKYYTLKMKRQGPSIIIAEVLVPTHHLTDFTELIAKRFSRDKYAIEIISTSDNLSVVFVWFPEDMNRYSLPIIGSIPYTFHWFRSFEVIRIAQGLNGQPYSIGLWLSPYARNVFNANLKEMKTKKKQIDPYGIFNRNKVYGFNVPRFFPLFPWNLILRIGIPIMSVFYRIIPKKLR